MPGIGTFLLERHPATGDFANKQVHPPFYTVSLQQLSASAAKFFYSWLAAALNTGERDAILLFNDFTFDLKKKINTGETIDWDGVGSLSKGQGGGINFLPARNTPLLETPVAANKIIQENSTHRVRVGEDERSSVEMVELLGRPEPELKRSYWWAVALVTGLLAIMFICWYFSEHGLDISTLSNNQGLAPQAGPIPYHLLP